MPYFKRLTLHNWRQFSTVDIDLSNPLTVLTGPNGCGKTTILNILNRHFGWTINFVSTPYVSKTSAKRVWSDFSRFGSSRFNTEQRHAGQIDIGSITYDDHHTSSITIPKEHNQQNDISYPNGQRNVVGMHIPSHRPAVTYHNISQIPTNPRAASQEYEEYRQLLMQVSQGNRGGQYPPGHVAKSSLISFAVFGEGNSSVLPNEDFRFLFNSFQEKLRILFPASIGFERIEIRMPDIVLITRTGDFSLEAMSGGINSLFSFAWQLHMFSHGKQECTITIDEPENHLHPSMQRSFLPSIRKAFPNFRFIIATHSPFIISSAPSSAVYALLYNDELLIQSRLLEKADLSAPSNVVLREILNVESNLPIWVEDRIEAVIKDSANLPPKERSKAIMKELKDLGLADHIDEYRRD